MTTFGRNPTLATSLVGLMWALDSVEALAVPLYQHSARFMSAFVALCLSYLRNTYLISALLASPHYAQVRALEELELMPQIQYLASVSGGSWFSTLYYYYQAGFEVS